jgi:FkbM family methyltransferase
MTMLEVEAGPVNSAAAYADQRAYERGLIDDALGGGWQDRVVIFGAGQIGVDALRGLRAMGIEPRGFSDNSTTRWGQVIDGVEVVSPASLPDVVEDPCIIVAVWRSKVVLEQLRVMGLSRVVSFKALFWHRPEVFLPYMRLDLPSRMLGASSAIRAVKESLADERSRDEFVRQLDWLGSFQSFALPRDADEDQYFAFDLFTPRADDVFVDCGAYDGDTARQVLSRWPAGVAVHALEPDPANCRALESWKSGLLDREAAAIHVHRCASSDRRCSLRFSSAGPGSGFAPNGDLVVEALPLDELFESTRTTFIKMDIEGAEVDALRGATALLRRDRPIVAACLYHRQEHLWEIPALLIAANPDYRLHIRRYGDEYGDVVCYAVPPERARR